MAQPALPWVIKTLATGDEVAGNFQPMIWPDRISPRNESQFGCCRLRERRRDCPRKINQPALKNQRRQNDEQISDDKQLQHTS